MDRTACRLPLLALLSAAATSQALDIQFTVDANGISSEGLAGFQNAASIWESVLHDNVTVNITIGVYDFGPENSNVIGQAQSTLYSAWYTELTGAMSADITSATDVSVVASLPTGSTYTRLINGTAQNTGTGNLTPAALSNDWIFINGANAKALGMILPGDPFYAANDATISLNSAFAFDYDRSNGIQAGTMDFVGVALHEIGHALGFINVADYLDYYASQSVYLNQMEYGSMPLDFLRYSAASSILGISDVTVGTGQKYLSINGTQIAMSTGAFLGDGQQASHFKDNLGLGLLDPTASFGEQINISANDLLVMDAIGWNLVAVPEPSTYGMALGGAALALAALRRRKA